MSDWGDFSAGLGNSLQDAVMIYLSMKERREAERAAEEEQARIDADQKQFMDLLLGVEGGLAGFTSPDSTQSIPLTSLERTTAEGRAYSELPPQGYTSAYYPDTPPLAGGGQPFTPQVQAIVDMYRAGDVSEQNMGRILQMMGGEAYEAEAVPDTVDREFLRFLIEASGEQGMMPRDVEQAYEQATGQDNDYTTEFFMANPDIARMMMELPSMADMNEAEREAYEQNAMADRGAQAMVDMLLSTYGSQIPDEHEELAAEMPPEQALPFLQGILGLAPQPAQYSPFTIGSGGGYRGDETGNVTRYEPIEGDVSGDYVSPTNIGGLSLMYDNGNGSYSQIETRMDSGLEGALYSITPQLKELGITGIAHVGAYNQREAQDIQGNLLGRPSNHSQGTALDIKGFYDGQGILHPTTDMNDPLVKAAHEILSQFPDFDDHAEGGHHHWHTGIGGGSGRVNIQSDTAAGASFEPVALWWGGLTGEQKIEYANEYGEMTLDPPDRIKQFAYNQYVTGTAPVANQSQTVTGTPPSPSENIVGYVRLAAESVLNRGASMSVTETQLQQILDNNGYGELVAHDLLVEAIQELVSRPGLNRAEEDALREYLGGSTE
jgi:hypothetical protein